MLFVLLVGVGFCCLLPAGWLVWDRLLPPSTQANLTADLGEHVSAAQEAWTVLDERWAQVGAGESVSCQQEAGPLPYFVAWRGVDRATYPDLAALADRANAAIRELHRAADRWAGVCRVDGESLTPQAVAEVRAGLSRAAAGLDAVQRALLR